MHLYALQNHTKFKDWSVWLTINIELDIFTLDLNNTGVTRFLKLSGDLLTVCQSSEIPGKWPIDVSGMLTFALSL